uniref:Retrotransposon gag domain-containing protein n=1 Tax=Nicotiana tabacum TaxID=4097 RepID=A0A1S3Y9G6_TOBAC|nr:PREDICTED: uncharacterized protein LOC107773800 [Nicotiana tabacum]
MSANTTPVDPTSPLFVYSSDVPGVSLVSTPFSGSGYGGWRRKMIVAESVQYSDTAQSIWAQLAARYGTANRTKIFELKRELSHTSQGSLDVASYFNKLKGLWDELGTMCTNHGQRCICPARNSIIQEDDENKVFQFHMGLNEAYMGVRSNLLMMQPPPTLDSVYNMVLNDEKQR